MNVGNLKTQVIIRTGNDQSSGETVVAEVNTPVEARLDLTGKTSGHAATSVALTSLNLRRYRRQMARTLLRLAWIFMTHRGS